MAGYYDFVLGLIPVALLGTAGALSLAGVSLTIAVPAGGLLAVSLIAHAMFVNGPADVTESTESQTSSQSSMGPVGAD